ncbi:hypothetical protein ACOSB0_00255, partial [Candidatus Phytoplasma citri]
MNPKVGKIKIIKSEQINIERERERETETETEREREEISSTDWQHFKNNIVRAQFITKVTYTNN